MKNAIGGYLELELPESQGFYYPEALRYQAARSAFLALLKNLPSIKRVWMPYYVCESMIAPVRFAGKDVCFYSLDKRLEVDGSLTLAAGDLLLYVNYFGVCSENIDVLLERFNPDQIVLDFSQAFYASPRECLATIYSPRKFFGLPDGGLLITDLPIILPEIQDDGSEGRMLHLLKRLGGTPEYGYDDFKRAEESLSDMEPRRMSLLTEKLMASVSYDAIRLKRNRNFQYLRRHLEPTNRLTLPDCVNGPLCYPYLPMVKVRKDKLLQERVFIPSYWPDVIGRVADDSYEHEMACGCIPIPCDQRYAEDSFDRILNLL